jgi:molecular chaperone GrpE
MCEEKPEGVDVDEEVDFDLKDLEIEKKDKEIEALSDKYKRLAAEYDNFRKRTAKEKLEIYSNSIVDIAEKFLPVLDNLDRAVKTVESIENKDVKEGVVMVLDQIKSVFDDLGIVEIDCCDEFDPSCHEAVMHIKDDSYGENTIAEVFQKGYKIGDRVIRCAVVKVAN